MVSAAVPEIGGEISILSIALMPGAGQAHLAAVDAKSPAILTGMATWEILEEEMFANLGNPRLATDT